MFHVKHELTPRTGNELRPRYERSFKRLVAKAQIQESKNQLDRAESAGMALKLICQRILPQMERILQNQEELFDAKTLINASKVVLEVAQMDQQRSGGVALNQLFVTSPASKLTEEEARRTIGNLSREAQVMELENE